METFGAELLPAQCRCGLETFGGLDEVEAVLLAVPEPVLEGNDVFTVPDVRTDDRLGEPHLFDQLPMQCVEVGLARVDAAAREGQTVASETRSAPAGRGGPG